jgi:predicted Na+-dependent transporter
MRPTMKYAFFLLSLFCFLIGWLTFEAEPLAALGFFLAALFAGGLSSIAREVLK